MNRRLRWSTVFRLYEKIQPWVNVSATKEDLPPGERIVVLAPHIDDETIGCGGVIAKHAAQGQRVAILTFADCTPERIEEGRAAGRLLGVARQDFLAHTSKTLLDGPEPAASLARFLDEERPDLVYVPGLFDRHVDHLSVNLLLARHSRQTGASWMVYASEIWNTLTPNVAVDITLFKTLKADALACFSSQNAANNWVDAALSLNRYRGITTGAGDYAEAFYRMTAQGHAQLYEHALGRL